MRRIARLRHVTGVHAIPSSTASIPARIAYPQCTQTSTACSTIPVRFLSTSVCRFDEQRVPQSLGGKAPTQSLAEEPIEATEEDLAILAAEDVYTGEVEEVEIDQTHYQIPPRASVAEDVDNISDPTYVPATTSEGLEKIGGLENWFENSANYTKTFTSFKPRGKIVDTQALRTILRRAILEALALKQTGAEGALVSSWSIGDADSLLRVLRLGVQGGVITGEFESIAADLQKVDETPMVPLRARAVNHFAQKFTADASWESLQLDDMAVKFAIAKRFFQLSGQRINDHDWMSVTDAKSLVTAVQKTPKAKTLSDEISITKPELLSTPNITFSAKRVTRGDKDKALGRFKIIEQEFAKRDLPLQGHGWTEKNKEVQRFEGKI